MITVLSVMLTSPENKFKHCLVYVYLNNYTKFIFQNTSDEYQSHFQLCKVCLFKVVSYSAIKVHAKN